MSVSRHWCAGVGLREDSVHQGDELTVEVGAKGEVEGRRLGEGDGRGSTGKNLCNMCNMHLLQVVNW